MNKTKYTQLISGNTVLFTAEKPIICPHCGAFIEPKLVSYQNILFSDFSIYLIAFIGSCCEKAFFATYRLIDGNGELLTLYPSNKPSQLPDSIKKISPRFINLYNQAYTAEQNNHFELAGCGYRNALEVLIKDYAINELKKDPKEVVKKSLNNSIKDYIPSVNLSNSADVIRLLGNDYTHYERHYEQIEFEVLKRYLRIFIDNIENEYLMAHPVITSNRHKE
ncbi:DUF4145 domain-containing protein [uncultured Clostridium sp.]|uniref:DUF4145 domain-containing protein n=1 Tax=uncultured Clostridium sp. TaxID=59620 RepID=UPI00258A2296|nr:DUF4145 domain-containing protein [uncultured Clostridium sp.]